MSDVKQIDDGGPAYPVELSHRDDGTTDGVQTGPRSGWAKGMSLRDWFAGMALQGFVANTSMLDYLDRHHDTSLTAEEAKAVRLNIVGHLCYAYADAMLDARKKGGTP